MKKVSLVVSLVMAMLILWGAFLNADVYIKDKESIKIGTQPERIAENELWVGKHQATYITPDTIYIYNKKKKKAWVVNRKQKTYVETDLPLDLSKLMSPETLNRSKAVKVKARVKKLDKTRTILDKKCTAYDIHLWMEYYGKPGAESRGTVWIYDGLGKKFHRFLELMDLIRQATNKDEAARKELNKLNGVQMRMEFKHTRQGKIYTTSSEVLELTEKNPPDTVYNVPAGYTQKETLKP
jgi:hypothetical protein